MFNFIEKQEEMEETIFAKFIKLDGEKLASIHETDSIHFLPPAIRNRAPLGVSDAYNQDINRDSNTNLIPRFGHDFSCIPVSHYEPAVGGSNSSAPKFLPAAPQFSEFPEDIQPEPLAKAGVADLYISVSAPAEIKAKEIFTTVPSDAPSSGISFQLSSHGKFQQDEYVTGILRWKPGGSRLPESKQEEEYGTFNHNWTSETVERTDLPGNPIMLKDSDTHTYGLAIVPGFTCEEAAKGRKPPFDRERDDWTFTEVGKFVDTVTFPNKKIQRVYYFDYRCIKTGSTAKADVDYTNVDKVERV